MRPLRLVFRYSGARLGSTCRALGLLGEALDTDYREATDPDRRFAKASPEMNYEMITKPQTPRCRMLSPR